MSYIDLVLGRDEKRNVSLYQAPKFSALKPDDDVIVKDDKGREHEIKVLDAIAIDIECDEYRFMIELFGMKEPTKILGKVTFTPFEYKDGDANDQK